MLSRTFPLFLLPLPSRLPFQSSNPKLDRPQANVSIYHVIWFIYMIFFLLSWTDLIGYCVHFQCGIGAQIEKRSFFCHLRSNSCHSALMESQVFFLNLHFHFFLLNFSFRHVWIISSVFSDLQGFPLQGFSFWGGMWSSNHSGNSSNFCALNPSIYFIPEIRCL